ncbi:MAG TPA: FkbM family methyltransferase [Elusimicrobiales bacterium]|nr:FkbM family methyltransferase [Elusimicrobiales bacterium]
MILKRLLKPLANLAIGIASCSWTRRAARRALRPFELKNDLGLTVGADRIYVNSLNRLAAALIWKHSLVDGLEEKLYRDRVKPGMTVLEIGANIGFFTLLFSRLAGDAGRVTAFEPDPGNFRLLQKNIAANGRKNITCVQKAVAARTGPGRLFISEENYGDHRIFDAEEGRGSLEIETTAIDDLPGPAGAVDFIKMDIQGAEYSALLGMEATIRRSPRLAMVSEFSPFLLRRAGAEPAAFLQKLKDLEFTLNLIDEENGRVIPCGAPELLARCKGEDYLNLFLEKPVRDSSGA